MEVWRTGQFEKWLKSLRDFVALGRISATIRKWELHDEVIGDTKALGNHLHELRIHSGPGYRVYFAKCGGKIVLLLIGGDKSSQQSDIRKARVLLEQIKGENNEC